MVDGDQQEAQRAAEAHRIVELGAEHLGQVRAVHLPGQGIEFRELDERAFAFMAFGDHAHDAERAHRLAVRPGEPAAGVLQPDCLAAAAPKAVLHLIGNAAAGVALTGAGDRVEPALPVFGIDVLREAAAAGDVGGIGDAEHGGGIAAPDQRIGVEPPFVSGVADRRENFRGVGDASRLFDSGHARLFLGTPRRAGRCLPDGLSGEVTGNI